MDQSRMRHPQANAASRVWPVVALLWLAALAGCGDGERIAPNIVLVSLDTTRADHLSTYGHERRTTPWLDAQGRRGLVFEQAITVSENTLISHVSLITGLYPAAHGASHRGGSEIPLQGSYQTLAEDFAAAGYQTGGFAGIESWLNARFGFDQGFERYSNSYRPAERVLRDGRAWLAGLDPARPFFLFLHLFDVHSEFASRPYSAPFPYLGAYAASGDGAPEAWARHHPGGSQFLLDVSRGKIELAAGDLDGIRRQYDEGLAGLDHQLALFLARLLKERDAWLVITADHGEEFLEHGRMLHTSYFDEVVRVPLMIVPPPSGRSPLGPPRRIAEQVSLVDLRPTLLSLAGLPPPAQCQGVDLLPWLTGDEARCPSRPASILHKGLRQEGYKLLKTREGARLFDLRADPQEQHDLAADPAMRPLLERMLRTLDERREEDAAIRRAHGRPASLAGSPDDPRNRQMLRDLGYLQ